MRDLPQPPNPIRASGGPAKDCGSHRREPYIWNLRDEAPGTLEEIFAAEDSRPQNLVLYEIRKDDGFRKCWEAIGAPGDPYDLIQAVTSCISCHLKPLDRVADHRRELCLVARRAEAAAKALEELATAINRGRDGWTLRLNEAGLPDPTDARTIANLRNLATGLDDMLARGALSDRGGRSKMVAFERLIRDLAGVFQRATGRPAAVTRDHHRPEGYSGRYWDFVEIVRPIATAIIETSGAGSLRQPATEPARGKFIESVLKKARTEKTRAASP
jgi:hypothetical protein